MKTKSILIICFVIGYCANIDAQTNDNVIQMRTVNDCFCPSTYDSSIVGNRVQVPPKFSEDVNKYFNDSIQYSQLGTKIKTEGTVYVSVIIEKDGSLSNITIIQSYNPNLNTEAKRVVSTMPKWQPGKQNGVPVRAQIVLPVKFKIQGAR